jgi:16S rRNA (guanine527-N7)-methyltransferase
VEHYQNDRQIDIVTCRAFASIPDIIRASRHLLETRTTILAMKGRYPEEELAQLPAGFDVTAIHRLQIPAEDSERHLIEINRTVS